MTTEAAVPMTLDFETSAETDKLDDALAKAQGEILVAAKDKKNPGFKRGNTESTYADIASIWKACRVALSNNGIAVTQWPLHSTDNRLHIVTRLAHAGQWMRGRLSIPVVKADPQGYGSAITYAKRFGLAAAVGVVAEDEDDDGQGASDGDSARLPETVVVDHVANIEAAADIPQLNKAYLLAAKAGENDQLSLKRFSAAANARKAQLKPAAVTK